MSTQDGGPAFPLESTKEDILYFGLTLRDYFAARAMLYWESCVTADGEYDVARAAEHAYAFADAMLKARQS